MTSGPIGTIGEAVSKDNLVDLSVWRSVRSCRTDRSVRELSRPHRPALDECEFRAFWRLAGDWRRAVNYGSAADILEAIDELEVFETHCGHHGLRHRAGALIRAAGARQTMA